MVINVSLGKMKITGLPDRMRDRAERERRVNRGEKGWNKRQGMSGREGRRTPLCISGWRHVSLRASCYLPWTSCTEGGADRGSKSRSAYTCKCAHMCSYVCLFVSKQIDTESNQGTENGAVQPND